MKRRALAVLLLLTLAISAPALATEAQSTISSPVLTADLPKDAELVENSQDENGYTERLTTSDGLASITLLRRGGSVPAEDIVKELYPDAKDVVRDDQYVIASYPATRFDFAMGQNEDSRAGVLVVFSTNTDTFAFATDATLDSYDGDEDYKGLIETWIESLDVFGTEEELKGTLPAGLRLTCNLPEDAEEDVGEILENGDYTQPYLIDSGMAVVTLARREAATGSQEFLKELYPEAEDVRTVDQQPIAAYPTERLSFTTGENEDARQCVLVTFSTDGGSFAFAAAVPADFYADYQETVEAWIASLDLVDG